MLTLVKAVECGDWANSTEHAPPNSSAQRALDAWESEGGSPPDSSGGVDLARDALAGNAGWRASNCVEQSAGRYDADILNNDDAQPGALSKEDNRILRCLGAAVMMRWNTLPRKLQKELFDSASSVGELLQAGSLKGEIARFLHAHKDDAG